VFKLHQLLDRGDLIKLLQTGFGFLWTNLLSLWPDGTIDSPVMPHKARYKVKYISMITEMLLDLHQLLDRVHVTAASLAQRLTVVKLRHSVSVEASACGQKVVR